MNLKFSTAFAACLLAMSRSQVLSSQHQIWLQNQCGNVEFDVNFMRPTLKFLESGLIANITVIDVRDERNQQAFTLPQGGSQPIVISSFQQPICTKRLLLEVCTFTDTVD